MVTVHHEPPVDGSHHLERGILLVDQKTMVTRRSSDVDLQSRAGMRGLHSSKSIVSSFPREKAETSQVMICTCRHASVWPLGGLDFYHLNHRAIPYALQSPVVQ